MATKRSILIASVIAIFVLLLEFHSGLCKTLKNKSDLSEVPGKERKLDNFVEFTGEGDQLAVESSVSVSSSDEQKNKNHILGNQAIASASGRQCSNVQKAVYPVIPVIIAFVVTLVTAIIISAIIRLIAKKKSESNDDSEYGLAGYSRRDGKNTLFGFDLSNFDFLKLTKIVLSAIEKTY